MLFIDDSTRMIAHSSPSILIEHVRLVMTVVVQVVERTPDCVTNCIVICLETTDPDTSQFPAHVSRLLHLKTIACERLVMFNMVFSVYRVLSYTVAVFVVAFSPFICGVLCFE